MAQYKTIAEWAKALGSSAKTKKCQRKVILGSFSKMRGLSILDCRLIKPVQPSTYLRGAADKASYLANRLQHKEYRSPAAVAERARIAKIAEAEWFTTNGRSAVTSIDAMTPNKGYIMLGGWYIRVREDVEYDWTYYSKSYRHPKKTTSLRMVCIRRIVDDGSFESRDRDVAAFRGSYLLDALAWSGICGPREGPLHVRLHDAYSARIVRNGRSVKIWERTLVGTHIDYCATAHGVTYHALTAKEAIAGLRIKLRAASLRSKGGIIDLKLCKELGFCDAGLKEFATTFDLDLRGRYTPEHVAERVLTNPTAAAPFTSELNTLAKAVNYRIPVALMETKQI